MRLTSLLYLLFLATGLAQSPPPAPSPTPEGTPSGEEPVSPTAGYGWIRTWVMLPPEVPPSEFGAPPTFKEPLSIIYAGADGSERSLVSNATPFSLMGYVGIDPGKYELRLMRGTGEKRVELAKKEIAVSAKSFLTVIVTHRGSEITMLVADDSHAARKPVVAGQPPPVVVKEIVFYNFLPNSTTVVSCARPPIKVTLSSGEVQRLTDLPASVFNLETAGQDEKQAPFSGQSEADLNTLDSLSYIVIKDIYGRTVPTLIPNARID